MFCAKISNLNIQEVNLCIELVEKWLKNENSITKLELQTTAKAITNSSTYINYSNDDDDGFNAMDAAIDAVYAICSSHSCVNAASAISDYATVDSNLYLQMLLRTTKQYNIMQHNNQNYECILKEIIQEDIDKLTDTDYNMLIDLSQEYYDINPNINNKRIFIELLRREYL